MKRIFSLLLSCMVGMSWVSAQKEEVTDPLLILMKNKICPFLRSPVTFNGFRQTPM
jgi:hypothetical protein